MERNSKPKAGPFDLDQREIRRNSFNFRRYVINTAGVVFVIAILLSSYYQVVGRPLRKEFWIWKGEDYGNNGQEENGSTSKGSQYLLGVGKADITGPVVEINMMGYADPKQVGSGLRQRLYSRAFIVGDIGRPEDRFVYLVLDTQSGDTAVRYGILESLASLGSDYAMYGRQNVAVTGTHSHSGPGAWLNYLLPQITSKGFILYAYLENPEEERARHNISTEDDGSVEKDLTLLKLSRASDGKNIGVLTWFPTHGTSMLGNNTLISGDNKGVAADLFEKSVVQEENAAEGFVAGFSQANVGDTTPNVLGAWCYSFAAGTSDGPGAFDFTQNDPNAPNASPVWRVVSGLIKAPTPGEATTMSGRRWREAIHDFAASTILSDSSSPDPIVVIGGPANSYTHYIATPEEYGIQRYEGASTLYGPYTLNAYINLTLSNLHYLSTTSTSQPSPGPFPQITSTPPFPSSPVSSTTVIPSLPPTAI
ncbi:hypothetical protein DID88_006882 [Monilinia fructigena]|uniref:Neutral ceramidase n=1 Tax=Monilinia fructigena TaxID=38457 RepID=A0A395IJ69_9HELO|nr:hypothetical protein DID88_006882 [Monilinia fructigena]